jgi:purine operon repressor
MKKWKRSARLIDMTEQLLRQPHVLVPLTFFAERYDSAKSSISEDLGIIKEVFEVEGIGEVETLAGAAGGVQFIPKVHPEDALAWISALCRRIEEPDRLLPGGYLYMSDLLGDSTVVREIGRIIASQFRRGPIDVVMTVETKGIPIAYAVASFLNVPVVTVRRDGKVTEGSVVSINFVSGSSKRIQTMSLARRVLKEHANVLIVDDFMKAGGTIRGMIDLLQEFHAHVVGVAVLVESSEVEERLVEQYISLARMNIVDSKAKTVEAIPGNLFTTLEGVRS